MWGYNVTRVWLGTRDKGEMYDTVGKTVVLDSYHLLLSYVILYYPMLVQLANGGEGGTVMRMLQYHVDLVSRPSVQDNE